MCCNHVEVKCPAALVFPWDTSDVFIDEDYRNIIVLTFQNIEGLGPSQVENT